MTTQDIVNVLYIWPTGAMISYLIFCLYARFDKDTKEVDTGAFCIAAIIWPITWVVVVIAYSYKLLKWFGLSIAGKPEAKPRKHTGFTPKKEDDCRYKPEEDF
ncbi:hypothetical protein Makalu002_069 [Escherichia phage Ec_Makalu_002]|uniref:Uncharacterized protein n=1 Tax=Escherichia phage Ec_Makalu_002 TaxID=2682770 RepID=A0A650DFZ5_9CAUD|nr:hypothetical protein Makalu002_069 [Escherichia phage Ec_Makalu_002]